VRDPDLSRISRRQALQAGIGACVAAAAPRALGAQTEPVGGAPLVRKPIPSSGERLPVIGLGTNNYNVTSAEDLELRREVLRRMPDLGGTVVDTAPAYGRSEVVLGELMTALGNRDRFFLATKVTAPAGDAAQGRAMLDESFRRLRTPRIDLMQVHNLDGVDVLMPVLREAKDAKRIRYVGVTTSNAAQYPRMLEVMRRYPLDFIQVDYSIDNREAAAEVLPLAQERDLAVLVNMPFGGRRSSNLFPRLAGRELPPWAAEAGAASWAQLLLRYVVSHSAVTCAIPGTHRVTHLEDNLGAGRAELPNAGLRTRMGRYWDSLT
jgi:aryl-alcohol dehydrogenase-like predicted oxidoreductase